MKKFLMVLGILVLALVLFILVRTLMSTSKSVTVAPVNPVKVADEALIRLQKAIQFKTVSYSYDAKFDSVEFVGLHRHLASAFPLVHSMLEKKTIQYSLLYKWAGTDNSLKPILLMSHMDVVPVDDGTLKDWDAPPFSGEIINGNIYGRGTMDDKVSLLAILEAVEESLRAGLKPKQTIYLAFGQDEELGGVQGAGSIAKYLDEQGVKLAFVIDEGGYMVEKMIPGLEKSLAVINVAEKGYVSFELTITTKGGHSSAPPTDNTIGSLAKAITKLESNQFPYKTNPVIDKQVEIMGPHMPFMQKMAFANTWLFGSKIQEALVAHTTTAPTIIRGGIKDNVIPTTASSVINFRVMTGETIDEVQKHIQETINDDRITVKAVGFHAEASPVSDYESASYKLIEKTILQLSPNTIVTPGLVSGGTDTKHYVSIAENVYRFFPIRVNQSNSTGFHGINEHLDVNNYKEIVQFYHQLIQNLNE
ncbi:MAG: M20 family peptidase [Bacteroidetes bacterium]|nr:M20 family peptidase [Bacteroidota bacterium]